MADVITAWYVFRQHIPSQSKVHVFDENLTLKNIHSLNGLEWLKLSNIFDANNTHWKWAAVKNIAIFFKIRFKNFEEN